MRSPALSVPASVAEAQSLHPSVEVRPVGLQRARRLGDHPVGVVQRRLDQRALVILERFTQ
jgi:hypothetical protein